MKYYPYGGNMTTSECKFSTRKCTFSTSDLPELTKNANSVQERKYRRELSLNPQHLVADLNNALQNLSNDFTVNTLSKHVKELSLFVIFVSIVGLLLLYIN
jgi:hypothetical protein